MVGNEAMKAKDYEKAVSRYNKALELSSQGPTSHIFLANRAAALCHLNRFEEAVTRSQDHPASTVDYVILFL